MHLKSLTLKGFKSFASATTLRLEPGITCVVGPNGSGKSNVVDAISWVLGEQGAKALRGGKMEDVIFAGTSGRAPLGRAEVTLTIDNSDGALPISYGEVSITRRMFRDGAGEYEINGSPCRLLDIQELLSDSGIGREMHVIVGQGQLDSVLASKPEDRRAYIEEAAGVLKHRKRKEKALRKLDAMQANLTRLTDLTAELRRQLKPLGRQAELARRAQAVQSELRDARLRLAADDLVTLRDELAREEADEATARARRAEVEEQLSVARVVQERLEGELSRDVPRLAAAQDTWYRLSALEERLRGTVRLAQERGRHLADPAERAPGRDPDELDAEADTVAEQEEELAAAVAGARSALAEVLAERTEHERTLAAADRAHLAAVRALADRRAGLATLAGRAAALRSGATATADEIERLSDALAEARGRTDAAAAELARARDEFAALDGGDGPAGGADGLAAAPGIDERDVPADAAVGVARSLPARPADGTPRVGRSPTGAPGSSGGLPGTDGSPPGTAAARAVRSGGSGSAGGAGSGAGSLRGPERHTAEAVEAHEGARARVAELVAAERELEQQRAHWRARVDALSVGLARRDGSGALLDHGPGGVLGAVSGLLTVDPTARTAIAAVLGELADAVVVDSADSAVAALRLLRSRDAGRAALVIGDLAPVSAGAADPDGPAAAVTQVAADSVRGAECSAAAVTDGHGPAGLGVPAAVPTDGRSTVGAGAARPAPMGRWAAESVAAAAPLAGAVRRLLSGVVVVEDLGQARAAVGAHPELTAVTIQGDVLTADRASGGSGTASSTLDVQAAVDDAVRARDRVEQDLAGLRPALDGARAEEAARRVDVTAARQAQNAAQARRAEASAQLGRLEQVVRSATAEAQRLRERRDGVEVRRSDSLLALAAAEQQLAVAQDDPVDEEPDTELRDAAADALDDARSAEVEARLALRTVEERALAIAGRADSLRRQASSERQARARDAAARAARGRDAAIAALVATAGATACGRIAVSLAEAVTERDAAAAARDSRERALGEARATGGRLTALLEKITDAVHRDEVLRAQSRLRLEQLTATVLDQHGLGVDDLVAEYGPDTPVPASADEVAEFEAARERGEDVVAPPPMPYDRATQQRRAQGAEKDLVLLGKVNPLALEEFAALEERYRFLSTQLEDLKNTRRDLLTVVREVDDRILEVFAAAFADVAAEFALVFETLFPGGEGRLLLTDPDDMLTTGVEVEARPPGKKVKRLSLLSGGERSLTAMALLVAIFRARPSPFYILDEIEAALDDINLRRLISLLDELRATSQLVVITHQKATMEVADALYGVAMRGDGITTVISQRLRPAS